MKPSGPGGFGIAAGRFPPPGTDPPITEKQLRVVSEDQLGRIPGAEPDACRKGGVWSKARRITSPWSASAPKLSPKSREAALRLWRFFVWPDLVVQAVAPVTGSSPEHVADPPNPSFAWPAAYSLELSNASCQHDMKPVIVFGTGCGSVREKQADAPRGDAVPDEHLRRL